MTDNRFAQLKENFEKESPRQRPQKKRPRASQSAPDGYNKKGRYPFALHHDVRYEKLDDLVQYYNAKSASDYLENLIIREWEKLQRKRK